MPTRSPASRSRASRRNPYDGFAQVYDQDVLVEVPRAFFRTLRPLVAAHRGGPPVLDLGCGSGLLTERIADAGARVVGIDGALPMLERARARCARHGRRVELVHARLERFEVAEPARLALACHDVVNHLPTEAVLRRVLARVRRALLPGGMLVFDTVTEYAFETYWTDNTHLLEGELGEVIMMCDWDRRRRRGTARIIGYARAGKDRFARTETVLHEWLHTDAAVTRALRAAGFAQVWSRPWSPWGEQDAEGRRQRRLWCGSVAPADPADVRRLRALGFRER